MECVEWAPRVFAAAVICFAYDGDTNAEGLSSARWTVLLSIASVEMTIFWLRGRGDEKADPLRG